MNRGPGNKGERDSILDNKQQRRGRGKGGDGEQEEGEWRVGEGALSGGGSPAPKASSRRGERRPSTQASRAPATTRKSNFIPALIGHALECWI